MAALESSILIRENRLTDLSEQYVLDNAEKVRGVWLNVDEPDEPLVVPVTGQASLRSQVPLRLRIL